jgi:hypothetical protein
MAKEISKERKALDFFGNLPLTIPSHPHLRFCDIDEAQANYKILLECIDEYEQLKESNPLTKEIGLNELGSVAKLKETFKDISGECSVFMSAKLKKLIFDVFDEYEILKELNTSKKVLNVEYNEFGLLGDCPNCKLKIPASNYCPNCGKKLDWSEVYGN